MDIFTATRSYEQWMAGQIAIVKPDLAMKHDRMAEDPFVFQRGTFYRWLQRWPAAGAAVTAAPRVLAVGDLHVENFGTWRDVEGRLVWGVNDVDEAWRLPYAFDLVRLATSAILATRHSRFAAAERDLCDAIVEGYTLALERGGRPLVLAERAQWLRRLALGDLRDPITFWRKLDGLPRASGTIPHVLLRAALPQPRPPYRVYRRVAGVGSLGRPRVVALAEWQGARIAREAKAWLPSAAAWASGRTTPRPAGASLLQRAVRAPDPCFLCRDGWIVRRLGPDCSRIELTDLTDLGDEERLLRMMGWETGNLHLGSRSSVLVRSHLRTLPRRWLGCAAAVMADLVEADWNEWHRGRARRSRR